MNIVLNGESRPLSEPLTLAQLLVEMGLEERRLAVEINGAIIPRGEHESTTLKDGDRIEIVHAIGGG